MLLPLNNGSANPSAARLSTRMLRGMAIIGDRSFTYLSGLGLGFSFSIRESQEKLSEFLGKIVVFVLRFCTV